jgi:hypothetical protein
MKIDVAYQSPVIRYDALARTEIYETRNAQTGTVSYQEPSAATVKQLESAPVEPASTAEAAAAAQPATADEVKPKAPVTETSGGFSLIV